MVAEIVELISRYSSYIIAGFVFVLFVLVGYGIRFIIDSYVIKYTKRTKTKIDDIIIGAIRTPIIIIFILAGVGFVLQLIKIPAEISGWLGPLIFIAIAFVIAYCIAKILMGFLGYFAIKKPGTRTLLPALRKAVQAIIYFICLMIVFDKLGISITPLLTVFGIAGIAIAFALQETLSSVFAGFYIMADRPLRVGDFVKLESGEEGYVIDVGWRSTRIRALANYVIVVPNSKLASSIVTNYYLPEQEMSTLVQVGVSYDSDLAKVEKVTIEVAKEVLAKTAGGTKTFEPFIRYHTFSDFSINFTVILRVNEFVDKYLVTHEFVKALHERYKKGGIEIPFPIRTVYMREGK